MRTAHTAASTRTVPTPDAVELNTCPSAHPVLRGVLTATVDGTRGTSHFTPRGANATEVDAVAHLVETFAPEVTVRAVSRKHDVYNVKAVASGRTRLYRIPVDMVPTTGRSAVAPTFDRAA